MSFLSIEIRKKENGSFQAHCPELAIYCDGNSEPEALNKMESLILFELTKHSQEDFPENLQSEIDNKFMGTKIMYVPHKTRIH